MSLIPRMLPAAAGLCVAAFLGGCGADRHAVFSQPMPVVASDDSADVTKVYQPLAVGNFWKYICNHSFTIVDRVVARRVLRGRMVYALLLQIPSSPTKSTDVVQLLSDDAFGNTWIHGYLIRGKIHEITAARIVAAKPILHKHYDYAAPKHGTISRVFVGFEYTNQTPLGVFYVAPYFESGGLHNYGYSLGRGVMEEDHGPKYKYDCLIEKYALH